MAACAPVDLAFGPVPWDRGPRFAHRNTTRSSAYLGERPVPLPTLFRFLATIAILAGLVFAGMFALATFVEPTPREISVNIPSSKLQPGGR